MRYEAIKRGANTWVVFDHKRQCAILKSVTTSANYNKEVCKATTILMNVNEKMEVEKMTK